MNNVTKALAYLLVMSLLLTAGGFYYHKTAEKNNVTPTPSNNTPTDVTPSENPTPVEGNNDFVVQAQTIFQQAQQQWTADSQTEKIQRVYCNVDGCAAGVAGTYDGYQYNITVNETGNVIKYYVTNGEYQFSYTGDGLFIEQITNVAKISDIDPSQIITITAEMN